eukprot:SM001109S18855  [mRNA]  locus=s1109:2087:2167:- [translate_table: standard]
MPTARGARTRASWRPSRASPSSTWRGT